MYDKTMGCIDTESTGLYLFMLLLHRQDPAELNLQMTYAHKKIVIDLNNAYLQSHSPISSKPWTEYTSMCENVLSNYILVCEYRVSVWGEGFDLRE